MRKNRWLVVFAVLSAVALLSTACSKQQSNVYKIGFIGDLTGSNSGLVKSAHDSAALAIKEANASGSLPKQIEFVSLDNKDGNQDTAPALAQKLINDKAVIGVVGPAFSGENETTGQLFEQAGLTHITQSATRPDLTTKHWKTFFRALANDSVQGGQTGDFIVKYLKKKRVALVNDKSPYGSGIAAVIAHSVQNAGGQVVLDQGVEPTTDYSSVVDSVLAAKPEVFYYAGYDAQAPLLFKQYRAKGGTAQLMGGDGDKGTNFLKEGGSAVEGADLTCPCLDPNATSDAPDQAFDKAYQSAYHGAPGIYSAEGWDVAQIFIAAIKAGGKDVTRASVLDYVTNLKDFKGLSKTFNWTATHEVVNGNITYAYKDVGGKYTLLGKITDLTK